MAEFVPEVEQTGWKLVVFRIIAAWGSREAWQRTRQSGSSLRSQRSEGPPAQRQPFRDVSAAHIVVGHGAATMTVARDIAAIASEEAT